MQTIFVAPTQAQLTARAALSKADRDFCDKFIQKILDKIHGKPLETFQLISELPLHMRHPLAAAIKPIVLYPHFDDLLFLDASEMPFPYLLMYEAGREDNENSHKMMNGVSQALFPDGKWGIQMLWALGFLREDTVENKLNAATSEDLKSMLIKAGIKVPATKQARLEAVLSNVSEDQLLAYLEKFKRFFPSPLGYLIIHSIYYDRHKFIPELEDIKKQVGMETLPIEIPLLTP